MAEIGETVKAHCIAVLDDGRELVNTRGAGEPLLVKIGAGELLPAVERALFEMLPGDRRTFTLAPEQAYGAYDESLVMSFPASAVPDVHSLTVGGLLVLNTRGGRIQAKVVAAAADGIVLDCNHELAGHAVTFDVEQLEVVHESAIKRELHPTGCACGCDKLKQQIG